MGPIQWLKLGIVGRAHGIRGSFFVSNRDEAIPKSIPWVIIGPTTESAQKYTVESTQFQSGKIVLKCRAIDDRNVAETLKGHIIWTDSNFITVDDSNEFLVSDLHNRQVFDKDAIMVGRITDVTIYPWGINLEVTNPENTASLDIPFTTQYVDMSFKTNTKELNLTVSRELFQEIWNSKEKNS
ncbi:MAG: hypothetical protein NT027_19455 [Proteobacteria bacterium]|nr:hypothetical protein [Pseudomonadota bacterium]